MSIRDRGLGILQALGSIGSGVMQAGGGVLNYLQQNPEFVDRSIIALEGLAQRPNQPLINLATANIAQRQQEQQVQEQANRTIDYFTNIGRPEIAEAIRTNPNMASQIYGSYVQRSLFPEPTEEWRTLTQAELQALGINDPSRLYQTNASGEIKAVGGSSTTINMGEDRNAVLAQMGPMYESALSAQMDKINDITASSNTNDMLMEVAEIVRDARARGGEIVGPASTPIQAIRNATLAVSQAFGIAVDTKRLNELSDDASDVEEARSILETVLFQKVQSMGGARGVTEVEFKRLVDTVPQLYTNPQAFFGVIESIINQNNNAINRWNNLNTALLGQYNTQAERMGATLALPIPFDFNPTEFDKDYYLGVTSSAPSGFN